MDATQHLFDELPTYEDGEGPLSIAPSVLGDRLQHNPLRLAHDKLPRAREEIDNKAPKSRKRADGEFADEQRWLCKYPQCLHHFRRQKELRSHWEEHHQDRKFKPGNFEKANRSVADAPILEWLRKEEERVRGEMETTDEAHSQDTMLCSNPNCGRIIHPLKSTGRHYKADGHVVCFRCCTYWSTHREWKSRELCDASKIGSFLSGGQETEVEPFLSESISPANSASAKSANQQTIAKSAATISNRLARSATVSKRKTSKAHPRCASQSQNIAHDDSDDVDYSNYEDTSDEDSAPRKRRKKTK